MDRKFENQNFKEMLANAILDDAKNVEHAMPYITGKALLCADLLLQGYTMIQSFEITGICDDDPTHIAIQHASILLYSEFSDL